MQKIERKKVFAVLNDIDNTKKTKEHITFSGRIAQYILDDEITRLKKGIQQFNFYLRLNEDKTQIKGQTVVFYRGLDALRLLKKMLLDDKYASLLDSYDYTIVKKLRNKHVDSSIFEDLENFFFMKYIEHRLSNNLSNEIINQINNISELRLIPSRQLARQFINILDNHMYTLMPDEYKKIGSLLLVHKLEEGL